MGRSLTYVIQVGGKVLDTFLEVYGWAGHCVQGIYVQVNRNEKY